MPFTPPPRTNTKDWRDRGEPGAVTQLNAAALEDLEERSAVYAREAAQAAHDQAIAGGGSVPNATATVKGVATLGSSGGAAAYDATQTALASKANSSHSHSAADVTGLGDAATRNVGAAAGTVAAGNDSRLSDARTPTAHTHAQADVTGLSAALTGKVDKPSAGTAGRVATADAAGAVSWTVPSGSGGESMLAQRLAMPRKLTVFGHSGAAGQGVGDGSAGDLAALRATGKLAWALTQGAVSGEDNYAVGSTCLFADSSSTTIPYSGWSRVFQTLSASRGGEVPIVPNAQGTFLFWTGATECLWAGLAAPAPYKAALRACVALARCYMHDQSTSPSSTYSGSWTTEAIAGRFSGSDWTWSSTPGSKCWIMVPSTPGFGSRTVDVCFVRPPEGAGTVTVKVDGGPASTVDLTAVTSPCGDMLPIVHRITGLSDAAHEIEITVASIESASGSRIGLDWWGEESQLPPLVGIVETQAALSPGGWVAASAGWPKAIETRDNAATLIPAMNAVVDQVVTEFGADRTVRLRLNDIPGLDLADADRNYQPDLVHLNAWAHNLMAATWLEQIVPMLSVKHELAGASTGAGGPSAAIPSRVTVLPGGSGWTVSTSDSFAGTDGTDLSGRATNTAHGGTTATWQASATGHWTITTNQLNKGWRSATALAGLPINVADVQIEMTLAVMPSGDTNGLFVTLRSNAVTTAATTGYRLQVYPDGRAGLQKLVSGTATAIGTAKPAGTYAAGDRIGLRCEGSTISLLRNGLVIDSVTNTEVTAAGGLQFSGAAAVQYKLDDLVIAGK